MFAFTPLKIKPNIKDEICYNLRDSEVKFNHLHLGFDNGQSFVESLDFTAIYYALYAILFAVVPMLISFLVGHFYMKIPISECFGVICGGMTFTPGLDIIREIDKSERPVVAYSSVYPVALILVILLVQGMFLSLNALGA
ncbi:MAG: hypothetical protein V5A47_09300 [Bacteroidales bacterium]|nr:hypothetical protein [Bacteroidales bacterium]MBS3775545.1 hypothetical protein [Bacteroidales bacterium]